VARIAAVRRGFPIKPLERDITRQVCDYLGYRGWRPIRMQRTVLPGSFQTGEPGQADYLFLRYETSQPGAALALWIEFKTPSGRLRKGQPEWHARERLRGGIVWTVSSLQTFEADYNTHFGWLHNDAGLPSK
jgi:hypothetical protein